MSSVTILDASGAVIGSVDAYGKRHMLIPDPEPIARPVPPFFELAQRCARMFKVDRAHFTDAALDDGADKSRARQYDAEMTRQRNAELVRQSLELFVVMP